MNTFFSFPSVFDNRMVKFKQKDHKDQVSKVTHFVIIVNHSLHSIKILVVLLKTLEERYSFIRPDRFIIFIYINRKLQNIVRIIKKSSLYITSLSKVNDGVHPFCTEILVELYRRTLRNTIFHTRYVIIIVFSASRKITS